MTTITIDTRTGEQVAEPPGIVGRCARWLRASDAGLGAAVLLLVAINGVASFTSLREVARLAHWVPGATWMLPISLDVLAFVASAAWLAADRGTPLRRYGGTVAVVAAGLSFVGNLLHGADLNAAAYVLPVPVLVATFGLPPVSLVVVGHLWWLIRAASKDRAAALAAAVAARWVAEQRAAQAEADADAARRREVEAGAAVRAEVEAAQQAGNDALAEAVERAEVAEARAAAAERHAQEAREQTRVEATRTRARQQTPTPPAATPEASPAAGPEAAPAADTGSRVLAAWEEAVAAGRTPTNGEIAGKLGVSDRTVRTYLASVRAAHQTGTEPGSEMEQQPGTDPAATPETDPAANDSDAGNGAAVLQFATAHRN